MWWSRGCFCGGIWVLEGRGFEVLGIRVMVMVCKRRSRVKIAVLLVVVAWFVSLCEAGN